MAGISRRKFSPQFKAEAVQFVVQSDRPITEVAGELGINPGTLGNWVNKYRADNPVPDKKLTPADHARLAELEHDNRRLRMENEFLKKPRPSLPGSRIEREVSPDRGGEGQLSGDVDVSSTGRGAVLVLCLAGPSRHAQRRPGPARGAEGRGRSGVHRPARNGGLSAHRR